MDKYSALLKSVTFRFSKSAPQYWADLGCGSGVFTKALADNLPLQSQIFAFDKIEQQLPDKMGNNISVVFRKLNFEIQDLGYSNLDGILMANSLHFAKEKEALIRKLEVNFKNTPRFLVIEYDRTQPNQWVPYPVLFEELREIFNTLDYQIIEKTGELKSVYGGIMYACFVSKN